MNPEELEEFEQFLNLKRFLDSDPDLSLGLVRTTEDGETRVVLLDLDGSPHEA